MSNDRSLSGTSLASETLARLFLWIQWFAPGFLESLVSTRHARAGDYPGGQSLATETERT